jgi:predicted SprT family Zn-dependent metalloprotease
MDTVLHEVAHALTRGDKHGARWKAKCLEIGARPDRNVEARVCPSIAYQYECSCCGKKVISISKIRKLILYVSKCCKAPLIFQKGPEEERTD